VAAITINSFIEDTSVLVAGAFLFVRGPMERLIKTGAWLGVLAGAFAASEAVFPGDRFPYAPHTLACAFATTIAGPIAGAISGGVAIIAAMALLPSGAANVITAQVLVTVACVSLVRNWSLTRWWSVPAAAFAQLCGIPLAHLVSNHPPATLVSPTTVPANAFGLVLLILVVRDARLRAESHQNLHDIDEARRIAAEAQLAIVRTRVQPHFLFNALNSIAALCTISPSRASEATIHLGKLMRRSLEVDLSKGLAIKEELETVRNYLAVEQERFGPKLAVSYDIEGAADIDVPAFSVQILVENAVLHGITPKASGGKLLVIARANRTGATVFVVDDGVGISVGAQNRGSPHGLTILKDQLHAICGPTARMHVVRRNGGGTIAAFHVPNFHPMARKGERKALAIDDERTK
jgi:hypothetical protein